MHAFEYDVAPQRILFGAGRTADLSAELDRLGGDRVVLVATPSAKEVADAVSESLPEVVARAPEPVQHVPAALVESTLEVVAEAAPTVVLAIGGGSAIGLGKAVAVRTGLPLAVVPTTYSGSETTDVWAVTDVHKRTGRDRRALPRLVVYDPELTTGLPAHLTATSGFNALAHAVEAVYAPHANPVSTLHAREAARLLAQALPVAVERPTDAEARNDVLLAAYLAGSAMAAAGTALHHKLCHVVGGTYALSHSDLHAVLLPYVVAYNADAAGAALRDLALGMGVADLAAGLRDLAERVGAPTDLRALGLEPAAVDDIVERTLAAQVRNPRPVEGPALRRLLEDACAGTAPGTY